MGILEADLTYTRKRRRRGWGRALSPRRVRALICVGQAWQAPDGQHWIVRSIHRKDAVAAMQGAGWRPRYVSFQELGRHYRPVTLAPPSVSLGPLAGPPARRSPR